MRISYSSVLAASGMAAFALLVSPAHAAKYPGALEVNGPVNFYPGQTVTYTVEATNIADQQLLAAVTTFHFDTSVLEFLPSNSTPGCSVTNAGYADCILGDMAIGQAAIVQFSFRVKDNAVCKSEVALDVDFKAAGGLLVDWVMFEAKVECKHYHKCGNRHINVIRWLFKKHHHSHKPYTDLWEWKHHIFKKVTHKTYKLLWHW